MSLSRICIQNAIIIVSGASVVQVLSKRQEYPDVSIDQLDPDGAVPARRTLEGTRPRAAPRSRHHARLRRTPRISARELARSVRAGATATARRAGPRARRDVPASGTVAARRAPARDRRRASLLARRTRDTDATRAAPQSRRRPSQHKPPLRTTRISARDVRDGRSKGGEAAGSLRLGRGFRASPTWCLFSSRAFALEARRRATA
jgi:hypothetical protein